MPVKLIYNFRTSMKAKLRMSEFAYFLFQHFNYGLYQFFYADTDWIYKDACVLKCKGDSWYNLKRDFFSNGEESDGRIPSLFKDEFKDTKCCSLRSKTYIVQNDELPVDDRDFKKVSSRGIKNKIVVGFDDVLKKLKCLHWNCYES